jgi:hypothetical protein
VDALQVCTLAVQPVAFSAHVLHLMPDYGTGPSLRSARIQADVVQRFSSEAQEGQVFVYAQFGDDSVRDITHWATLSSAAEDSFTVATADTGVHSLKARKHSSFQLSECNLRPAVHASNVSLPVVSCVANGCLCSCSAVIAACAGRSDRRSEHMQRQLTRTVCAMQHRHYAASVLWPSAHQPAKHHSGQQYLR